MEILGWVLSGVGTLSLLAFLGFAVVSFFEQEVRAAWIALGLVFISGLFIVIPIWFPVLQLGMGLVLAISFASFFALCSITATNEIVEFEVPGGRIDERDIMFARARLRQNTPNYDNYYAKHQEKKRGDDQIRKKPGLLQPGSKYFNASLAAASHAIFEIPEHLRNHVEGRPAAQNEELGSQPSTHDLKHFLKHFVRYLGGLEVGVCNLQPYHFYSHVGRGTGEYGSPIECSHRTAIVFTLEMKKEMVDCAPATPITLESARNYANGATIAVQVAHFLRSLGHDARAHIDGNYRVIAPLVARDAGLGEIGRMGILMTPKLGPRVRLGVITTDVELEADPIPDFGYMIKFCNICKKCADTCPSRAIPMERRNVSNGALRWQINQESCFHYWVTAGTDCGKCMAVCPFSHPDNLAHNVVRRGIQYSEVIRRAALLLDDFFYSRHPKSKSPPSWSDNTTKEP